VSAPPPLCERLGIFQGRLVPSTNGQLQCSPGARWPDEFTYAADLGLAHIELLAERTFSPENPVWSDAGRRALRDVARGSGVGIVSLCSEEPLDLPVSVPEFGAEVVPRLAAAAGALRLDVVVLPLFEASALDVLPWDDVAANLRALAAALGPTRVVLECPLPADAILRFLDLVGVPTVGVCYDLGNTTAAGHVPAREIPVLGPVLWHVHAKDKDATGANVRFGTGLVDFDAALGVLADLGYDGRVTMEATRGDDPVVTAAAHRDFLLARG
jgi:sugar phosphate isomerase/epimerase